MVAPDCSWTSNCASCGLPANPPLQPFSVSEAASKESAPATTLAPPRLVQVEPMKIAKKPWGFTSAPLMLRPHHAPPAPPPPPEPEPAAQAAPVPRLPGRAGFLSSPLCIVPPKPRVLVQPSESAPPPPPPEDSDGDCDSPKSPGSPLSPGARTGVSQNPQFLPELMIPSR